MQTAGQCCCKRTKLGTMNSMILLRLPQKWAVISYFLFKTTCAGTRCMAIACITKTESISAPVRDGPWTVQFWRYVGHGREPCKNGWTDRDAAQSRVRAPKELCITYTWAGDGAGVHTCATWRVRRIVPRGGCDAIHHHHYRINWFFLLVSATAWSVRADRPASTHIRLLTYDVRRSASLSNDSSSAHLSAWSRDRRLAACNHQKSS